MAKTGNKARIDVLKDWVKSLNHPKVITLITSSTNQKREKKLLIIDNPLSTFGKLPKKLPKK